jgi:hypothetical protein
LNSFRVYRNKDEPKEVEFEFKFNPNEYLESESLVLKKSFSNLQSPDSEANSRSTKVPIKWKEGKDITKVIEGVPPSFFTWFAFEEEDQDEDEFPDSVEVAVTLADEIYPHAHRIFQEYVVSDESGDEDEDENLDEGNCSIYMFNNCRR